MDATSEYSHSVVAGMTMTASSSRTRQRPACEECRRRKLRCDGKKPQCSTCENSGAECDINTNRVPRGPKKGYLTALQSKIATLESRLHAQEQGQLRWSDTSSLENGDAMLPTTAALSSMTTADFEKPRPETNFATLQSLCSPVSETESFLNTFFDVNAVPAATTTMLSENISTLSTTETSPRGINITNSMQAELDQIYFDRIHAVVPILHQRRYLSRSKSPVKTRSRECLQYAVWATASLMSAQFQYLQDMLYPELKRMLASTSLPPSASSQQLAVDVELAQAWVLTATYEFIKTYHHEACISAGRAFRLVQLMRLHEIDHTSSNNASSTGTGGTDFIITEEMRRVFWMTFTLEALYSMRNNLPLVMNEHMISTFLPVPDHEFQNGQRVRTGTLSDCIAKRSQMVKSPLNECILLIAMCARGNKQQRYVYSHGECDRLEWQRWLDDVLSLRLQTLAQDYPSLTDSSDPMLLFANFLAQASVLYLWREILSTEGLNDGGGGGRGGRQSFIAEYQERTYAAVERTIELARSLSDFPFSKIHPFTPIPLFLTIEFLSLNNSNSVDVLLLHNLLDILRQLINVNNAQQSYIELLGFDQVTTSLV